MAKTVLRNATVIYGGHDIAGVTNEWVFEDQSSEEEVTTFDAGSHEEIALGLRKGTVTYKCYYRTAEEEPGTIFFDNPGPLGMLAVPSRPAVEGDVGWLMEGVRPRWKEMAQIGRAHGAELTVMSTRPLNKATVLANLSGVTASTQGVAVQLRANQDRKIRALLAVLNNGGTGTLDATIESDDTAGMSSAVTVATFPQLALTADFHYLEADGANADDWYRLNLAIAGPSPDFTVIAALAVD